MSRVRYIDGPWGRDPALPVPRKGEGGRVGRSDKSLLGSILAARHWRYGQLVRELSCPGLDQLLAACKAEKARRAAAIAELAEADLRR